MYNYQQGTKKLTHTEGTVPVNYGYDANGNIASENTWTYVYDLSNRLIRLEESSTPLISELKNTRHGWRKAGTRAVRLFCPPRP
jgi:uncharacterized protein RhaS with RHS repeats